MPSRKSHIQLYADECFPLTSSIYLKSLGYSVVHAFDKKMIRKSDQTHLRISKQLGKVLITLDRDFLYYERVNLSQHPGVIVVSVGSATPPNINKLCRKLFKNITEDFVKNSLIKATANKIIKMRKGKIILKKEI